MNPVTPTPELPKPKRYVPYMDGMDSDPQAMMVNEQDDVEYTGDAVFIRETDYTAMRSALEARCGELEGAHKDAQFSALAALVQVIEMQMGFPEYRNEFERGKFEALKMMREVIQTFTDATAKIATLSSNSRKEGGG